MTDLIERAKAALETHENQQGFMGPYGITDLEWMAPDLARALIREREAADVDLIEQAISDVLSEGGTYREAAEYVVRTIRKETEDDK